MGIFRIKLFYTFRAYAMAKISLGVIRNISFKLIPIAFVIPYLLARSTHGQQTAQLFHVGKCFLKLGD
jgi:hypothetical protein